MKIGIDIRPLIDKNYSGVSWYTVNLVKTILKKDQKNKYKLFYNSFKNLGGRIPDLGKNAQIIRYRFPNKILNFSFRFFKWPKIDKWLDCDIILMPNINFISVSKSGQIILIIHDLSFLRRKEFFNFKMRLWHWFVKVDDLAKKSFVIISVSENTKKDIVELLKVEGSKVRVIHSGLDSRFKKINQDLTVSDYSNISNQEKSDIKKLVEIKKKYNLPDIFLFYLGTIEPRKNISGIIKAYGIFRDKTNYNHKLILAGAKGWKTKRIYKDWKDSKYKNDIIFLNYIKEKDKPFVYNLASLFIFPSFYEGFGFPPLEALACGTPVISSFSSSLNEIIGDQAILIDPYNSNDIARAMQEGIDKPVDIDYKKIRGKYNWEETARKYLSIINN